MTHNTVSRLACLRVFVLACLLLLLPLVLSAATHGPYTYSVSGGKATIERCDTSQTGALTIPDTLGGYPVTAIGDWAFDSCTLLTSVTIAGGVTDIGEGAFYYCTSLASVFMPDAVTSIGGWAFDGCTSLASVTIPANVSFIDDQAFANCESLTNITVSAGNQTYASIGGVLYNESCTTLLLCPAGLSGAYTIPDDVAAIGGYAFIYCTSLTDVVIPGSVTNIGARAFFGCTSLTDVTIPGSVTAIGDYAFSGCTSLANVTIADGATIIGESAFSGCTSLAEVTILGSVINIGASAFSGCTSLTDITIPAGVSSIGGDAFANCESLTNITVAAGNTAYADIGGVLYNKSLTMLLTCPRRLSGHHTIPGSVTFIADYAFYECTCLTSVLFTGNAPSAGSYVFDNVTATLYYRSSATGWETTFAGYPTTCWNPFFTTISPPSFSSGTAALTLTGTPGIPVRIEVCDSLATQAWNTITITNLSSYGTLDLTDSAAAGHPSRFYRVVFP